MVVHFEPRGKGAVECLQFEDVALAGFGLEALLGCSEKGLDQAARTGIPGGAVNEIHVEPATGRLQGLGVVDLGVVQIQLFGHAMDDADCTSS